MCVCQFNQFCDGLWLYERDVTVQNTDRRIRINMSDCLLRCMAGTERCRLQDPVDVITRNMSFDFQPILAMYDMNSIELSIPRAVDDIPNHRLPA